LKHRDLLDIATKKTYQKPEFKSVDIFKDILHCEVLDHTLPHHYKYAQYLIDRKIDIHKYVYFVSPNDNTFNGRNGNRVIIPYTYQDKIVGYTSRYLDDKSPKYINVSQSGYVFGYDFQKSNWAIAIVTEGIFDALSIDGCAVMHNTISTEQAMLLRSLNRKIIVVPDRDSTGLDICDRAIELGFSVSLPKWHHDVKDVNDAVIRYGKFPTILSIIQAATNSSVKVELIKRNLKKMLTKGS
jgi:DNA primase